MQELIDYLNSIKRMSPELIDHLKSILKQSVFRKHEIILRPGKICYRIHFLEKGLIHIYNDKEEKSTTLWLQWELAIFISITSFYEQKASIEWIQALEECITWSITYAELVETCRLFPEFDYHWKKIEQFYRDLEQEMSTFLAQPASKRCIEWLRNNPEIYERTPDYVLMSYLRVNKETFYKALKICRQQKDYNEKK